MLVVVGRRRASTGCLAAVDQLKDFCIMKTSAKLAAALIAITAGAGSAMAANTHMASGKIERINAKSITVNHRVYRYDAKGTGQGLKPGESVRVTYRWGHGHRIADRVEPGAT